jgi:UDP-N-acetylglucosamine 1-carboxyvinyltransferase
MAAVLAHGRTVIDNASREPEIEDLAAFLTKMGAKITGAGTSMIEIDGVDELRPADFEVMPDRLEAATFLFACGAAGGEIVVTDMNPAHLDIVLSKLTEAGASFELGPDRIYMKMDGQPKATDISTLPYPGFPTDLQPLAVATLARSDGLSIVTENIFDARFIYVDELARMGADVHVEGRYIVVRGVPVLTGAPVRASDIRAGAALVVAALSAEGQTVVNDLVHIDRGHERLEEKLTGLGASIERITAPEPAPL